MAKPIKETPVLKGEAAVQFLEQVEANEKQDHSAAYSRAKSVYNNFVASSQGQSHVRAHAG
jgi:hypothetical protein